VRSCFADARQLVVVTLFGSSALFGHAAPPTDPFAAIPMHMEQFVNDGEIAGAVTLVSHRGKIVHLAATGLANRETGAPMASDSLFGVMSMTKPVTATALMILVDEGKLALDAPVEKYIPAFTHAKLTNGEPVRGLTIRHLLTHTSGLGGKQECQVSLEATAAMLAERPFDFQPGEKWQYGPSLNPCGRLIEIASGQSYADFVAERILAPLGMANTTFRPTDEQRSRVAALYELDDKTHELKPQEREIGGRDGVANPSGGLYSTASDMARFYHMILAGGELDGRRIVSADAVRQMTTVQTGGLKTGFTPGNAWGLGWCIVRQPEGVTGMLSPGTYGHGGAYGTQGWVDPERQAVFILLLQRSNIDNSDASDMRREFQRLAVEAIESHKDASE
jgi:CubicO group peptidase (beta-lactamase class C family)